MRETRTKVSETRLELGSTRFHFKRQEERSFRRTTVVSIVHGKLDDQRGKRSTLDLILLSLDHDEISLDEIRTHEPRFLLRRSWKR